MSFALLHKIYSYFEKVETNLYFLKTFIREASFQSDKMSEDIKIMQLFTEKIKFISFSHLLSLVQVFNFSKLSFGEISFSFINNIKHKTKLKINLVISMSLTYSLYF